MIEQTKTNSQETLEVQMNKHIQIFSFSPPINLVEVGKRLLGISSFETTISVFFMTNENKSFSITIPGYWSSRGGAETVHKLQKVLELRPQNDIELPVEEVKKRGNRIKIGDNEYNLSELGSRKNEIIEEMKNVDYNDLEDMVFGMELTYSEIEKILDVKYIDTSTIGYTLPPGIYEIDDKNLMLKNLFPNEVKLNIKIDDIDETQI